MTQWLHWSDKLRQWVAQSCPWLALSVTTTWSWDGSNRSTGETTQGLTDLAVLLSMSLFRWWDEMHHKTSVKMISNKWKYLTLFCLALDRLAHVNLDCMVVTMSCIKYALISILWSFTGQSDFPQLFLVMNQEVLCNGAHYAKCLNKSYFPNNPEDTDHCRALYWHCQFDSSSHKRKTFPHLVKPLGVPTTRQSCFAEVAIVNFLLSFYWSCFLPIIKPPFLTLRVLTFLLSLLTSEVTTRRKFCLTLNQLFTGNWTQLLTTSSFPGKF